MSLRITHGIYHNFGPFGDSVLKFDEPGLTVVEGQIHGKQGCDSNGAGKSFLFDGIAWCLFGRCIRDKYKGDDVIALDSKGGCSVQVTLEDVGKKVEVTRYRGCPVNKNDVILKVNGKNVTRGTSTATTDFIEKTVGMSFTSFCNSVAFGVREDVKSFFVASDADRKKVLERILGLTLFTDAEQVARRRVKKVIEEHGAAKSEMEKLQAIVSERKAVLFDLTHSEEMEEIDLHLSIRKLTAKRLRQKHDRLEGELAELRDVEAHEEAAWEEQQAEYKLALTKYEEAKTKLQKGLRQVERAIAGQQGLRKAETQKAIKFEKLAGKKCPTCTQAVGAKLTKKIDAEAKAALTEIDGVLEELAVTEAELTAQIKALEPPEYVVPPASLSEAVQAVKSKEAEWNATGKLRAAEEARVEEMEASRAMVEGKAAALQTQIAQAQQVIETREEEVEEAEAQMQALEFWVQGFGNQGLKSFMIEAELPEINKRATYYAQRLLGSGARVRLSATSKLKTKDLTKEQLSVEGSIPGLTNSYAGASKGQRKRMDLSLLLAFRETVAKRDAKAFQQLFADEIFDGLDKTGAECVVALLKETASECPVMLVTHDSRIKPVADRLVTVVHDGSRAKIQI